VKTLQLGALLLCAICCQPALAQRGAGSASGAGGFRAPAAGGGRSMAGPAYGRPNGRPFAGFRRDHWVSPMAGWPWVYPGFDRDFNTWVDQGSNDRAPQVILLAMQLEAPPAPPPPPEPARPVIREYAWPNSVDDSAGVFALANTDGTVSLAIAVWVQDGMVHHVNQNGMETLTALNAIDRGTTRRLNAEKGLNLSLPAGSPPA
jgi:hypothetical protein